MLKKMKMKGKKEEYKKKEGGEKKRGFLFYSCVYNCEWGESKRICVPSSCD
jgi:hypothetical protein